MLGSASKGWLNKMNQYSALLKRDVKFFAFSFKQSTHEEAIKFIHDVFGNEKIIRIIHCDRSGTRLSIIFESQTESES